MSVWPARGGTRPAERKNVSRTRRDPGQVGTLCVARYRSCARREIACSLHADRYGHLALYGDAFPRHRLSDNKQGGDERLRKAGAMNHARAVTSNIVQLLVSPGPNLLPDVAPR